MNCDCGGFKPLATADIPESFSLIHYGSAGGILSGAGGTYLFPGGGDNSNTTTVRRNVVIPFDCVIDRIDAIHNAVTGATDVTYAIEKENILQTMSVVLNSGSSGPATSIANPVTVAAGERIAIRATQVSGGTLAIGPMISIRLKS